MAAVAYSKCNYFARLNGPAEKDKMPALSAQAIFQEWIGLPFLPAGKSTMTVLHASHCRPWRLLFYLCIAAAQAMAAAGGTEPSPRAGPVAVPIPFQASCGDWEQAVPFPAAASRPTVFLQFYDWFNVGDWDKAVLLDPFDWTRLELDSGEPQGEEFYLKQFNYIKALGVDALSWEYHPQIGLPPTYPSPVALAALAKSGLKIAPFYDLEISFKVRFEGAARLPTLSNPNAIKADQETANHIVGELREFFNQVPKELLAQDNKGRVPIFVFGYGFDDADPDPGKWSAFADSLAQQTEALAGMPVAFYWTTVKSVFQEHLFLHHRDRFVPFHFVLDTPQSQFGHDSVTWNFGFDNLVVQRIYGLQRVIRVDPRYIQETGWLAGATRPAAVFLYSWNEPFEGSFLMPSRRWSDTKARLAAAYIWRLKNCLTPPLPATVLIVDDLDALWTTRKGDWHLQVLREMLLYALRRFAPQAEVVTPQEVTAAVLDRYQIIIDLTSRKDPRLVALLLARLDSRRLMIFDPPSTPEISPLSTPFVAAAAYRNLNRGIAVANGAGRLFARDDVWRVTPCRTCRVLLNATLANPPRKRRAEIPLVIARHDDVWVNSYAGSEIVLHKAFEALYERPLRKSILYGEALSSQRLEIAADTKQATRNTLSRYSVNLLWPMPVDIDWLRLPEEVDERYFRFLFGLDPE